VIHRRHEIGIRMALGGQRQSIFQLVMREALMLTLIGLIAGLTAAFAVTRLMATLLFGVEPADPLTFAVLTLVLGGVALAASYLPARRATKVDPLIVLRSK
jgi:ABC-type antimicrobial peptide transport system permease subunit